MRSRVLLSVQRALLGEITREMQAVAVAISDAEIRVLLVVDAGASPDIAADFDAGAMTQIVADFPEPDRGDPAVTFESIAVAPGEPVPLPAACVLAFARAGVRFEVTSSTASP